MEDFDNYSIEMDTECLHQDIDDIDLYADKTIEESDDNFGSELKLE